MKVLVLFLVLIGNFSLAKVPEKEILDVFNKRLGDLSEPDAFKKFVSENPKLFPDSSKENPSIVVERESLKVDDESYTLAIGYRQFFTPSKNANLLKSLWTAPELFQRLYNLDADSTVKSKDESRESTKNNFKARIYKKVPAIGDQDYTLQYTASENKSYYFIRAKLVKDEKDFALRDNLKVLEETSEGLVVREISYLYPLKWYVRALGPTTRNIMKDEINKVSLTEKCLAEQGTNFPPTEEAMKICVQK